MVRDEDAMGDAVVDEVRRANEAVRPPIDLDQLIVMVDTARSSMYMTRSSAW